MSAGEGESPGWYSRAAALFGGGALVAGGITFSEDPVGFIRAVIAEWIVGGILDLGAQLGGLVVLVGRQIQGALGEAGGAALGALGTLAILPNTLLNVVEDLLRIAVTNAGPFAPLVWVAAWVGALVLGAVIVRLTIEVGGFLWTVIPGL